jgi:gliding motility-associated-like protein
MADSAVVTLVGLPTPYTVTGGGAYCTGDTGRQIGMAQTDTAISYSLYLNGLVVSGLLAGTGRPINFGTFTAGGVYTARGFNSVGCDTVMNNTVTITPLALPTIVSLTSNDIICYGAATDTISVIATSSNGGLHYSVDSGVTYVNSTGVFIGLPPSAYYVFVEDDSMCKSNYVVNPVVITQPTAPLTVSSIEHDITCSGANNGSIQLLPSGGWGAYTYDWSSGQTIQVISGLSANIYTGSVTDIKGCTVSITDTIHNPTPISDGVRAVAVTCAGASNGYVSVTVSGGTSPYSFLWSNFSVDSVLTNLSGGIYYVIITDANGCEKRDSAIIAEGLPIVLTDTVGQTSCSGVNNSNIHIIVSGGSGSYTYTWSPPGPNSPDNINVATGTYYVTVTDGSGCSATISVSVNNVPALAISHQVTEPSCNGLNNGSINLLVTGGAAPYSYNWQGAVSSGPSLPFALAGTYYVTVTDGHGCSISDSIVVNQPTPMYISGIQKNVSCHGYSDGYILPTGYGGTLPYSYQWYLGSDTFAPIGPITQNIIQLSGGFYYLVITDANGCKAPFSTRIIEPDSLEIALVKTDATCQAANSGSVAVTVIGGTRPYQFLWNNFVTDSFQNNIPGGNYGVVVTDSNGCHQTESIVVNGQPSPMYVNMSVNNPTCNGGTNGFVALDVQGGAPPYSYAWSTTPAQTGSVASNLTGGTYYVTVADTRGCQVLDTAAIVAPAPIDVTIGTALTTCISSADGYAVVNVTGGVPPYTYQLGTAIQHTDTFTNLAVGVYTLLVTDANGCQGNTVLTINSTGNLAVTLSATPNVVLAKEPVQLEAAATSDTTIIKYIWNPLDSLNFSGCADSTDCDDPIATPTATHLYAVTVENARGCTVTDTVRVTVSSEPSIFIPTAFTPNGDNLNDRFEFDILGAKSANVQIWNRWGERVFSNPAQPNGINDTHGWDGKLNGDLVQYDTYTYQFVVLYFDGHQQTISGTVVVMR